MKRVLAIILTALIIITAMPLVALAENSADLQHIYFIDNGERSCTEEEFRELVVEEPKLVLSKSWSYNSLNLDSKGYYYTYLSSSFEKKIYNGCYNITPTNSTYKVSFDDLNGYKFETAAFEEAYENLLTSVWKGMFCYRLDNPYNCDSFSNEVEVADAQVSCGENNIVNKMYITIKMANHPSYEPKQITQRNARIAEIAEIANRQKTPYSKLKAIYEEIIKTSQYDFSDQAQKIDHMNTEVFYYAHNSLGVLNKGLGVCESYAKAFKLVCDYMDIAPCILLTSTTHMWNVVYLDGAWYGLDATWDDPGDGDGVRYQYFLCGDPDVVDGSQTSHIPDAMYTTPPDYSDTPYVSCDEGHKQVIVPGTPATCTMTGTTDRVYCSVCGETITASTVIGKLPHTITYVPKVAATYYSTGNKSHYKCTVCKGLFSDKNGVNQITAESVIIPQLTQGIICEHLHYTDIPATPATTEKSGLSAGRVCDLCETVIIAQQEIPRIASIKASKDKYTYTGKAIKPGVVITDELGATISSSNYTLSYSSGLKLPGTYTITVKFKGKYSGTHKCSFKIIISNPSPKASTSTSSVKLSWGKVSGASGYIVYDANKKKIKDVGSATSYTISKRKAGTTYTYYVRTYKKISGKAYCSDYVKITTSTLPAAPKVSASSSAGAIKYTWGKVLGASGYEVYNGSKKVIKDCGNTTSYTLSGRKAGTSYSVYMRAYRTVSGKRYYSSYVKVSYSTKPANPVVNTSSTTSSIKYSWGKVSGATGYIVYNGSKKVISDRKTSTSYSLTKRSSATTYTVYVRAYRKTLGKTFYSDYVKVTTSTLPAAPKVSASSSASAIKYTWGKVSGASGYEVYNGSKKVINDCGNATSYTLSGCKAGTSYSVYMRAYRTVSGKRYYSSYVKVSCSTKPSFDSSSIVVGLGASVKLKLNTSATGITWATSNKTIATVSSSGVVTGKKEGTVTITATAGGQKATIKVTVKKISISLDKTSVTLLPKKSDVIKVTTTPDTQVTWTSSDTNVVSVDEAGTVTGNSEGTATITAYFENGGVKYSATCTVTVKIPTYSGYGFDSVPDFCASLGSAFTLKDVYDRSSDTEFLYGRSNAISAEEYEVLFAQYREFLALKGFTFLEKGTTTQDGWPCTVEYYQNSATGTRLMFVFFDDGDVSIVILK